ncbi:toxin glutamine deamidase domain-containing protein [Mycobacterium sp. URHB0044]|uniref:toxin glutamine deamidase domain-containing protein n=1 Tax=Mycobacterium sp. URHB0044 TaxID=1380386 RepID=UPI00350FAD2D
MVHGEHVPAREKTAPTTDVPVEVTAADTAQVAESALAQRIPPVRPDELRNPLGPMEEARARARNNATWWNALTSEQRTALIETHPQHIGNAEGIPAADRHTANHRVLQQLRDRADQVQARIDDGARPSRADRKFLQQVNRLDLALRKAGADAARVGVDGPVLLAFDPAEFGGDGRAVLSFGDDPYTADSVSWHVPGVATTVHSLFGFYTESALNHLQSTRSENPTTSAASIAWIGYDTPSGMGIFRAAGHQLARTGGDLLYSDITAFNAARDTLAGDGSHFTGNHVFGYSYGSTTTGYAGQGGRLAGQISTVSLVGSPGVGPMRHAGDFGIGADHVFVASSSRDLVTALGGRTPGSSGRILGIGLGVDPAMDYFGAQRIAAEFTGGRNQLLTGGTHHAYYLDTGTGTHVRTESLANLGRIAAGRHDQVTTEAHRTVDGRRTLEPAANRSDHRIWNPPWRSDRDCAHVVADELSSMYGRDIRIAGTPSRSGTPARSLFEAAGTRAEFATYDDVAHRLIQLGDGSSAVLASRWAGGRNGGHAYLAINDGGEIQLYDPHTRQRSAWPPHWGENAVSRTAVGYLGAHGNPVSPLTVDTALQLGAADAVGHVRGLPADPDFVRRQEEYRAQDPATRHVDTRYAQSLADVIDDPSQASVNQLADDLSGMYGPHRIRFDEVDRFGNEVLLTGKILHGDTEIGTVQRGFARDSQGNLVAYHNGLVIKDEFTHQRGQGFSKALTAEMERFYVHSGVDRIELQSHDKGTRAWARRGFTWDPDPARLQQSLDRIRDAALHLSPQLSAEARTVLDELVQRLHPDHPRLPELIDIVDLAAPGVPNLGERLVDGVKVNFVRYLPSDVTTSTPQAHNGFGARLKRLFGIGGGSRSDQDCARTVADELSAMYEGRDIRVATARTPMGTPAWALFEAVGTRAEFATYDDVAGRLHRLGDGASAVLASRWAGGHRGGHAYLAVNEDGEIRLYDPHTRQRSGWPPHWGQGAVAHTAVGYLDADGNPVQPVNDVPLQLQLDAADLVGDVKGHAKDPDFQRAQAEYRAQDVSTREVNTRYAEPLADVVRNLDQQQVRQLADDLSGIYGPYRVEMWRAEISRAGEVIVAGYIFSGDEGIGFMQRTFVRGADGNLVARHDSVEIDQERFKFKGFSRSLSSQLEPYYARSGVDRIELSTEQDGGYVWARRGFTWNADTDKLEHSLQSVRDAAQRLMNWVSEDAQAVLLDTVQRLESDHPRLPEPIELASLATPDEPDLGRQLMYGTKWFGVKHLLGEPTVASTALTPSDFAASPARGLTDHFRGLNCAHLVANEVWEMYGREIRIEEPITSSGVPARALFEAIGSHARFATYDEVADELRRLGPGSSAVLASRWAGGRQGGHAYLAINVDDEIFLVESHSGRQQGWPPYWGEGAVARTAVGYLDPDGNPTHPLHDRVLQLSAADEIGDVAGPREGLEFQRAQEDYRAQDPTSRQVDTRYAEPLGDVVDDCWDRARVQQLAEDLSGMYGPYRVEFYPQNSADAVFFDGVIFSGTQEIGTMMRRFARDGDGNLVAHHILVSIDDEHFRGNGFSKALTSEFERYYQRSGFDRIQLATSQNGGYAWARRGFTWNPDPARLEPSLRNIRASAYHLRRTVSAEAARVLDDVMARLHPERSDLPDPIDLAALATPDEPDLGRRLMDGAQWNAVKYLRGDPAAETSSHNCAQMVTDELSARYGRDVRLGIAPSRSGVPARALFEAVGSSSRFATYDDVAQNLRELGERSAAVLASGWAHGGGRYGGHAYLAVNDGGLIHLVDPFTGERTGWPPAWGQHAVYRTAVGYLDANGDAVHPLGVDRPLHLYAAETVGDVKGHPDDGDGPLDGSRAQLEASTDTLGGGYPSPDDVELAGFWDRIGQLDLTASTPEAIAEAVYQPVPLDDVTNLYEGRVSGFKTGEVVRAQQHLAETMDNAFFVSADIANLRGLNQASADRTESNAHFSAMADIFRAGLTESGADVVPMRVGGDELGAVVVGDIDDEVIDSALATIRTRVKEYAQEHNLADIPHPKHPGQPEYNGVGLHLGYAEVLPDLDVRDIFNLADLGVDQSKTRSTDVAGGQGRATRADGVEPGGAATAYRAAGTRTGRETTGSEGEVAGRASTEGEPGHALSHRVRYPQPEDVRRAAFIDQAARIRDADPGAVLALHEPLRRDEVSDFYDGRGAAFKTGEVDRARRWTTETGGSGFFVSAQLVNLSGLNQHVQNRAEVANAHYRAVTEIFRTEIEATGATVVPMRTSGDRFDAVVVGRIEAATVDAAITAIHEEIGMYTRREGLSDIANPSNAERRGVHLRFGYADITTSRDAEGVVQTAEARMFGRKDFGDPRRAPETPIDDIPRPRQPAPAENPVFLREQRDYRAQDRTTRNVDTRFAEPLPDVLDNAGDGTNIDRLATDLSGGYGPYRVNFRGEGDGDVFLAGVIMRGDRAIGTVELDFFRDHTGDLIASIGWIAISDDTLQRKGFTQSLIGELEQYCQRSGVDRMSLATQDNGGVVWARLGFTWDRDPQRLQLSLDSVKSSALRLRDEVTDGARAVLDDIVARLDPQRSDLPEPRQLTEIATRDVPDLGRRLMDGTRWFAVKHLHGDVSPSSAQLANDALAQRIPPAGVTELVHPNGDAELAVERAQANATWWQGLSEDLRQAMVENHPVQIGNAEGIPPSYRHDANARALADWLRHRDQLQFRRDSGFRLGFDKQKELDFLNSVDDALRRGADAARTAGVDGPRLLKFDPSAFDGNGIAVVGFGVDPYLADSVSWHIPGRGMTIEQLGAGMGSALNHLSSVLHEDPTASAASVTWIGYDTVANDAARIGGETLYADIRAFNTGRDAWVTDGSHFGNNHVYGHCQGSTVVGHAGAGGRLDRTVRTVILFGSPGAGPINHAREFGQGVDVYVAASSTDSFTWEAGHTPGSRGTFLDGFGVDPAMDFFGAQRITAEFPLLRMAAAGDYDMHNFYYKFDDKSTGLRTESLANFGRIASGHVERVALEEQRAAKLPDQTQIYDPASVRPAVEDHRPPVVEPAENCAHAVAETLSTRYGHDVRIEARTSPTGVAARGLFEAVGSRAEFAPYAEVADRLVQLGSGSSAVLASRWAGTRHGGHAYLAVNDGGELYLVDARTGGRSGWPPHWGERAVAQTAAGFLDASGQPVRALGDNADELVAADAIGDVQGAPHEPVGPLGLPDYAPGTLSDVEATTVYSHGEQRMRELDEQLQREGMGAEERARILFEQKNSLRAWTRDLMSNRTAAEVLAANESTLTFDELVARNEAKGLSGDAVFDAIIDTATHGRFAPGSLSDVETTLVYSDFELRLRELNEQLVRDGMPVDERARLLSDLRSSLRGWTRELMSNRAAADWLAANESNPSFEDLVARYQTKGLTGDAVYEAIIDAATHSHYATGTLSNAETRTVYTTFELRMREVSEQLVRDDVGLEEQARTLYELRASIRTWTRALMADRETADYLTANEPNPTFEDLVARQRAKGRVGDEIYRAIIASATRSRASVNESLGIDPENPPELPPMRGPTNND